MKLLLNLKAAGRRYISKFADRFSRGHSIFLLAIPLAVIEIALRWLFPGFQSFFTDWANVSHYWLVFMYGFYIVRLQAGIWLKYFVLCLSTIVVTYLCCELAKSNRISRFVLGMK
ncbi:hypothetical protein D1AOALGA4SA_10070 [Olavius algarvensis Delta 1 endosymbiont]|nr:hypothetical protein D1AOALGA4SA_10070 [Olavius algarvensis Delta 1 endosymbiont]